MLNNKLPPSFAEYHGFKVCCELSQDDNTLQAFVYFRNLQEKRLFFRKKLSSKVEV